MILKSGNCVDSSYPAGLRWSYDDDTAMLTITCQSCMADYDNSADVPWAELKDQIKTMIIEYGAKSIGKLAFLCYESLTTIKIPDIVTEIGYMVFSGCTNLKMIYHKEDVDFPPNEKNKLSVAQKFPVHVSR